MHNKSTTKVFLFPYSSQENWVLFVIQNHTVRKWQNQADLNPCLPYITDFTFSLHPCFSQQRRRSRNYFNWLQPRFKKIKKTGKSNSAHHMKYKRSLVDGSVNLMCVCISMSLLSCRGNCIFSCLQHSKNLETHSTVSHSSCWCNSQIFTDAQISAVTNL